VAVVSTILGVIVCQALVFVVADAKIISDTLWCVIVGVLTYYIIGPVFGTIVLVINMSSIVVFVGSDAGKQYLFDSLKNGGIDTQYILNIVYVTITLAYIMFRIMKNNKEINQKYQEEISRNEILLKEIHHRVKNNLQIISSLLRLQAADARNESVNEHFNEAINRIRSMALIHEKMYSNDDLSEINIQSYLTTLLGDITYSMNSDVEVSLDVTSEVSKIDIKSIVPISLIFNELITNSIKHAFKDKTSGVIQVNISFEGEKVLFKYSDDGKWKFPDSSSTFGFELIKTLVDQLDGTCVREIESGTQYLFSFDSNLLFFKS
jgi:two-component sensor histidine kinase